MKKTTLFFLIFGTILLAALHGSLKYIGKTDETSQNIYLRSMSIENRTQDRIPVSVEPRSVAVVPESVELESVVPESAVLESAVLESAVPESVEPESVEPESVEPELVIPESVVPESVVPESVVPESMVHTLVESKLVKPIQPSVVHSTSIFEVKPEPNMKPTIAICAATHSKSNWRSLADTSLQNTLVPSIARTISAEDRVKYDFRLYLAADHDDEFWLQNKNNVKSPDWLSVKMGFYDVPKHKIPFNPMMRAAYNDGAEYMVRINDDSEFVTSDWVSKAVAKLASYSPPNVGMVGPNCREGNYAIMTHDMVHRTHLDIFEHYYPNVFSAWWVDDWISKVYGPQRSTKMMDWTVKHHTHKYGRRYKVQQHEE